RTSTRQGPAPAADRSLENAMPQMAAPRPIRARNSAAHSAAAPRRPSGAASTLDLLQRKEGACACGGQCPRCKAAQTLQAKLPVSQPGDALETEADRVADQVMRSPAWPGFGRTSAPASVGEAHSSPLDGVLPDGG